MRGLILHDSVLAVESIPWLRNLVSFQLQTLSRLSSTPGVIEAIAGLTNLKELALANGDFGYDDILLLAEMDRLESLKLCSSEFTSKEATLPLGEMKSLVRLEIRNTNIDDAMLEPLLSLSRLEYVGLYNTTLSDKGLLTLARLASLRELDCQGTAVTPAGIARFRKLRPDVLLMAD